MPGLAVSCALACAGMAGLWGCGDAQQTTNKKKARPADARSVVQPRFRQESRLSRQASRVPGEYLITLHKSKCLQAVKKQAGSIGGRQVRRVAKLLHLFRFTPDPGPAEIAPRMKDKACIKAVQANLRYKMF